MAKLGLIFVSITYCFSSFAFLKGTYLPKSELPNNVCKVVAINMKSIITPVDQNKKIIGKPIVKVTEESVYCSSTLIGKNHVMTAAHCYEGAIEKFMPIGQNHIPLKVINPKTQELDYPQMCRKRNGKLRDDWRNYKFCVKRVDLYLQETEIQRVEIRCPLKEGGEEVRIAAMEEGWPHPMYMSDPIHNKYDMAVLRVEKPFIKTVPAKMLTDFNQVMEIGKKTFNTCRSFGYGLDNEDNYGELKGIKSPLHVLTEDSIIFKTDTITPNRLDHGDSGGALFCRDVKGEDYLVGVISRGGPIAYDVNSFNTETERNVYALLSYNKIWLDMIIQDAPESHGLSSKGKEQWRAMTVKFQLKDLTSGIKKIDQCFSDNKRNFPKAHKKVFLKGLNLLKDNLKIRYQDYRSGKTSFYLAGFLAQDYKMKESLMGTCHRVSRYRSTRR